MAKRSEIELVYIDTDYEYDHLRESGYPDAAEAAAWLGDYWYDACTERYPNARVVMCSEHQVGEIMAGGWGGAPIRGPVRDVPADIHQAGWELIPGPDDPRWITPDAVTYAEERAEECWDEDEAEEWRGRAARYRAHLAAQAAQETTP